MTKEEAGRLIEIYGRSWETRDPELIVTIFTDDATYNDPREPENIGIGAIKKYWQTKVIGEQDNIKFNLLNLWIDGETVIAEWHATFRKFQENILVDMTEVAIFGTRDGKFSSLREYYKSIKTQL
jgi:ketosteroid isomerase-like protein